MFERRDGSLVHEWGEEQAMGAKFQARFQRNATCEMPQRWDSSNGGGHGDQRQNDELFDAYSFGNSLASASFSNVDVGDGTDAIHNVPDSSYSSSATPFNPALSEKARKASRIPWNLTTEDVQAWMDLQNIEILKSIYKHAVWLLEQHGIECEDRLNLLMSERVAEDWFEGGTATVAVGSPKKAALPGASNAGNEVEPGEIWEPPAIPSLISMNVPPPPKSRNRANNLQQQANHRWEQHKLTGWKGPEPPVRVQPQVHGALPPTGRGRGAWKKGGTLHSVSVPTSKSVPAHNVRPIEAMVKGYENPNLPVSLNPNATQSAESSSKSNRGVATQPHRIVPPTNDDGSFPEAKPDQEKLTNLQSNFNLMQFELNKICRKFRISVLNEKDLSIYPKSQQPRLKAAVECVTNARNTLNSYKNFLMNVKYKEWNDSEKKRIEGALS